MRHKSNVLTPPNSVQARPSVNAGSHQDIGVSRGAQSNVLEDWPCRTPTIDPVSLRIESVTMKGERERQPIQSASRGQHVSEAGRKTMRQTEHRLEDAEHSAQEG